MKHFLIAIAIVVGLLFSANHAAGATVHHTPGCVSAHEFRVINHHEGNSAHPWTLKHIQHYVGAYGKRVWTFHWSAGSNSSGYPAGDVEQGREFNRCNGSVFDGDFFKFSGGNWHYYGQVNQ